MSVRVKLRTDLKSMIKFGNKLEERWFINLMRSIRDSDPKTHPIISIRDKKGGEIPRLPPPKPPQGKDGKPINVPQKLTPEMIKKMEIQQGKPIPPEILEKMRIEKEIEKKTNEAKK